MQNSPVQRTNNRKRRAASPAHGLPRFAFALLLALVGLALAPLSTSALGNSASASHDADGTTAAIAWGEAGAPIFDGYDIILQDWREDGRATRYHDTMLDPEPSAVLTSEPPMPLSFGRGILGNQNYTVADAIETLTLPVANRISNGASESGAITYTLWPALPGGLSFDALGRTISGTPTDASSTKYTYTASAPGYSSASLIFTIAVSAPASDTQAAP